MDDLRSLGSVLMGSDPIVSPGEARKLAEKVREGGFSALKLPPSPLDLQDLPPTHEIEARLRAARAERAKMPAMGKDARHNRAYADRAIALLERDYQNAQRRDEIDATRPEGCWCLGYGGARPNHYPIRTDDVLVDGLGHEYNAIREAEVLTVHCACEDGRRRAVEDAATLESYREYQARQAIVRRFGDAKIPKEYQGHAWREHPDRGTVRRVEAWLMSNRSLPDAHHWLLLYGPGGRGKTTILVGLASDFAAAGASVLYRPTPDLLDDIRATFGNSEETEAIRQLLRTVRHLFLDDVGTEIPRDWVGEFYYGLLNHRHNEHLPTYLASNLDLRELAGHLGERIFGRVKRMAEPIRMDGRDLRDLPHRRAVAAPTNGNFTTS